MGTCTSSENNRLIHDSWNIDDLTIAVKLKDILFPELYKLLTTFPREIISVIVSYVVTENFCNDNNWLGVSDIISPRFSLSDYANHSDEYYHRMISYLIKKYAIRETDDTTIASYFWNTYIIIVITHNDNSDIIMNDTLYDDISSNSHLQHIYSNDINVSVKHKNFFAITSKKDDKCHTTLYNQNSIPNGIALFDYDTPEVAQQYNRFNSVPIESGDIVINTVTVLSDMSIIALTLEGMIRMFRDGRRVKLFQNEIIPDINLELACNYHGTYLRVGSYLRAKEEGVREYPLQIMTYEVYDNVLISVIGINVDYNTDPCIIINKTSCDNPVWNPKIYHLHINNRYLISNIKIVSASSIAICQSTYSPPDVFTYSVIPGANLIIDKYYTREKATLFTLLVDRLGTWCISDVSPEYFHIRYQINGIVPIITDHYGNVYSVSHGMSVKIRGAPEY